MKKKTKPRSYRLSPKIILFCKEYLIDLNGTEAAIRAKYSKKTAASQASRLLTNVKVQEYIQKAMDTRARNLDISASSVLQEIAKLAYANMDDFISTTSDGDPFFDLSKLTRNQSAAIESITVEDYVDGRDDDARDVKKIKIQLAKKNPNLKLLGQHLKLFVERHEVTGKDGKPIEVEHRFDPKKIRECADSLDNLLSE